MPALDCVVVGYFDGEFRQHQAAVERMGPGSPEFEVFRRDQLSIDGVRRPYMDVVSELVNGAAHKRGEPGDQLYHVGEVSNLAAVYLTNYLQKSGFRTEFVSILPAERDTLTDLLVEGRPEVVAITTTFYLTPMPVINLVRRIREHSPDATVVVGGPLVANLVSDLEETKLAFFFDKMGADAYVLESQGEQTLADLLAARRAKEPLSSVPNVFHRADGTWELTTRVAENNDLNRWSIDWSEVSPGHVGATAQTRTARSCAFSCAFCDYPFRAGKLATADVATVERELAALAEHGVRNVVFIDDTFNVPIGRFKEICRAIIRNSFDFSWFSYLRCSNVPDEETFDLMHESRCGGVFLGIESGDETVLANMNKRASLERYTWGLGQLNDRGIASFASFIAGFPGETEQTVQNTIAFIESTKPTFFRVEPLWYNRRAPIGKSADDFGLTGSGYRWSHGTMDSAGACAAVETIFDTVTQSRWMPTYMFDFWALPYLLGKGMSLDSVKEFHERAQDLMRAQLCDVSSPESAKAEAALREFGDALRLDASKFRAL